MESNWSDLEDVKKVEMNVKEVRSETIKKKLIAEVGFLA